METILRICEQCVKAISEAAWRSYREGDSSYSYNGCSVEVNCSQTTQIYISHDPRTGFDVQVDHPSSQETPNFDKAIISYLEENTNPEAEWEEVYDNDDHDCQTSLDSGFGSWQDYYDYMYS